MSSRHKTKTVKSVINTHHSIKLQSNMEHISLGHFQFTDHEPNTFRSMPTHYTELPFSFPRTSLADIWIDDLLQFSLRQQKDHKVSDNSAFVSHVIHLGLKAMGVQHRIVVGIRGINNHFKPHMWLEVKGVTVDNTYNDKICGNAIKELQTRTFESYRETDLFDREAQGTDPIHIHVMKKRIDFYQREPDMALALAINRQQAYNYFFAISRFVYDICGVTMNGVNPQVRYKCWGCHKYPRQGLPYITDVVQLQPDELTGPEGGPASSSHPWKFQQCYKCMVANYCSQACQKSDWELVHRFNCCSREYPNLLSLDEIEKLH